MAVSTSETISTLNNLIETCKDGENGFREAAADVKRSDLKDLFMQYAQQRAQFASELQSTVTKLGEEPETTGSAVAALHRRWIDVKSAITGKDDHAILEECERGEDSAVANYREAIAKDLPSDVKSVLNTQYQTVLQTHNRVRDMRNTSA